MAPLYFKRDWVKNPPKDLDKNSDGKYRFQFKEYVGGGTFGVVFKYYDTDLKRDVAIKISGMGDNYNEADFKKEAHRTSNLGTHPNIVEVYDLKVWNAIDDLDNQCLVMQYCPDTLDQILLRDIRLSSEKVVKIGLQLSDALMFAHKEKPGGEPIVHRDIKPTNILFDLEGVLKLCDFGISKSLDGQTLTQLGGTLAYAPYEQVAGFIDAKSDIYTVGVVMYELLNGSRPYELDREKTLDEILEDIKNAEIETNELKRKSPKLFEFISK